MNERVKKIAQEQGIPWDDKYHWYISNEDLERFAELIVQECASLFPLTFTDEQYQRRIDKTIRKHFGVDP
jgi:hypothetical protein